MEDNSENCELCDYIDLLLFGFYASAGCIKQNTLLKIVINPGARDHISQHCLRAVPFN